MGAKRSRFFVSKTILLIAAMCIWADIAKTVIQEALSKPTAGRDRADPRSRHAHLGTEEPAGPTRTARLQSRAHDWPSRSKFGINRLSDNEYLIDSTANWSRSPNVDYLDEQARIVPCFQSGICKGVRFVEVLRHSLYAQLGLMKGDVVRTVNGLELGDADQALHVYQMLRGANLFVVRLDRAGKSIVKTYRLE